MTIAENIKRIRKERGLTQKQLGEKCGISESTLRQYEIGYRNPKLETIQKIASALDVEAYELDERISEIHTKYRLINQLEHEIENLKILNPEETFFTKQYTSWIEDAKQVIDDFRTEYAPEDFKTILNPYVNQLLDLYNKLNVEGQKKAIEAVENITFNPKYIKTNRDKM